jgi:hypothetical protein
MVNPPYCWKNFAQCRAILESIGWQVCERSSVDEEVPDALLVVLHPHLPLKVAIYALEDIQLLAQSVSNQYFFRARN